MVFDTVTRTGPSCTWTARIVSLGMCFFVSIWTYVKVQPLFSIPFFCHFTPFSLSVSFSTFYHMVFRHATNLFTLVLKNHDNGFSAPETFLLTISTDHKIITNWLKALCE